MATGDRKDPYLAGNFLVEVDGITRGGFQEAAGLEAHLITVPYREGNEGRAGRRIPVRVEFPAVTLRRGLTDDADLWEWFRKGVEGKAERRNVSIIQLDETGTEKVRWNLREAVPTKWVAPRFNAAGTELSVEALELEHEGLTRIKGS